MKNILFLFFLLSCSDDSFRKVEELDTFRIIAIEADAPEVAPGETSNLNLYLSDAKNPGRNITFDVKACVDPGIGRGADVSCDFDPSAFSSSLNVNTASLGAGAFNTGASPSIAIPVPSDILQGRTAAERFNGVGYIVIFSADIDGKEVTSFRRILVTSRPLAERNKNPAISRLELNGSVLGSNKPKKNDELSAIANAPEAYSVILSDGTTENRTETYRVAWYLSAGTVNKPKARIDVPVEYLDDPPADDLLVIAVVRDERGGVVVREVVIP
jgi:hypothetical protein